MGQDYEVQPAIPGLEEPYELQPQLPIERLAELDDDALLKELDTVHAELVEIEAADENVEMSEAFARFEELVAVASRRYLIKDINIAA